MEGPGVYLIKEKLSFLRDKKVVDVRGNTKENKKVLLGKIVKDVKSLGKRLIFEFDDFYLIIHFLMYGSYRLNESRDGKIERLSMVFDDGSILNIYNASIKIVDKGLFKYDESTDVMSKRFNKYRALKEIEKSERLICDVLLDQEIFSGVGNIIKNEALFRARIHPLSISKKIERLYALNLINEVLSFSKEFYNSRKNNERLKNKLLIYGKRICPSCNERIKIKYLGITKRRTYFCDKCQKLFI